MKNVLNQTLPVTFYSGAWRSAPETAGDVVLGLFPAVEFAAVERANTLANYPANPYQYTGDPETVMGNQPGGIVYFGDQFLADWRYRIAPVPDFQPVPSRVFGPWRVNDDSAATVDSKYNLTSLADSGGTEADATLSIDIPGYYGGEWVLEWDETVCPTMRLTMTGGSGITCVLTTDDAANGRRVYTVTVPDGLTESQMRSVTYTVYMAAPVTGYNDWHLYMPGHEAACKAGYPFNRHWVDQLADLGVIRCMDVLNTNNNPASSVAELTDDSWGTWSELGIPFEYCIRMARAAGVRKLWLNFPHQCEPTEFAAIAGRLRTEYLATPVDERPTDMICEYSNEVWNTAFSQTDYGFNESALDADLSAEPDPNNRLGYWVAKKALEVKSAMETAFGGDASIIKLVVCGQVDWPQLMQFRVSSPYHPAIATEVDYVGVAPYFGTSMDEAYATSNNVESWTDQQYVNYFLRNGDEAEPTHQDIPAGLEQIDTIAGIVETATGRSDIPMVTYEMGQHLDSFGFSDTPQRALIRTRWRAFNESDSMGYLYYTLNQELINRGFKYLVAFGGFGGHSDVFYWGTQDNVWGLPYTKKLADAAVNLPRVTGQSTVRAYMAAHSLWQHGSVDYLTGEWLYNIAAHDSRSSLITGKFGQLSDHAAALPTTWSELNTQFSYPFGEGTADSPWTSGAFSSVDWDFISLCPWNFAQGSTAYDATPDPLTHALTLIDFYVTNAPDATIFVFEHWPETGMQPGGATGANLSDADWRAYWEYTRAAYHTWFVNFQDQLNTDRPSAGIRMIPVGPVLADLFLDESYMDAVPSTDYFEDDAPHGLPALYFLSALVFYRFFFGVNAPTDYTIPTTSPSDIPTVVRDNYSEIVSFIDNRLTYYNVNGVDVY